MLISLTFACTTSPPRAEVQDTGPFWSTTVPDSGDSAGDARESGSGDSGRDHSGRPDSGETGPGPDTGLPIVYDCSALSPLPIEDNELDAPVGYHDVAFDDDGNLIGWDTRATLMQSRYDNSVRAFAPGFDNVQGIDRFPNGEYVVGDADNATLWRVSAEGGQSVLAADLSGIYGVMVGPDGNVYVGSESDIYRVDPATGSKVSVVHLDNSAKARAVAFSPDNRLMYVATVGRGQVYQVVLDDGLNPVGEPTLLVERTNGRWHDAIGVDACGNVYVAEFYSAGLNRITPEGAMTVLYAGNQTRYGHGFEWGSGIDGWRADALYLTQPYDGNSVRELVIGVPSAKYVRE